ncbi:hypothetical protein LY78DRAFT_594550 [Colletotrichum sublineola]|nr:hypothetical protein LY78DRAFT_594550 [Colletotrichum sublineola]
MYPFQDSKRSQYVPADSSSDCEDDVASQSRISSRAFHFMNLIVYTLFPILCVALLVLHNRLKDARVDSGFLKGFPTELDSIKGILARETVTFTGGLFFTDNDTLWRDKPEGQPQYVGAPSPEIDAAWEKLLNGTFMNLIGPDALDVIGRTWQDYHGNYMVT